MLDVCVDEYRVHSTPPHSHIRCTHMHYCATVTVHAHCAWPFSIIGRSIRCILRVGNQFPMETHRICAFLCYCQMQTNRENALNEKKIGFEKSGQMETYIGRKRDRSHLKSNIQNERNEIGCNRVLRIRFRQFFALSIWCVQ